MCLSLVIIHCILCIVCIQCSKKGENKNDSVVCKEIIWKECYQLSCFHCPFLNFDTISFSTVSSFPLQILLLLPGGLFSHLERKSSTLLLKFSKFLVLKHFSWVLITCFPVSLGIKSCVSKEVSNLETGVVPSFSTHF